jgi:DNA-binding NarL/FixJ family response regulator
MSHRVVLIDDHPLLQLGLEVLLERSGLEVVLAEPRPADQLVPWLAGLTPRCAVVDLGLPIEGGGLSLIGPISATGTAVLVLTGEADAVRWAACLQAGAEAVVSKSEPMDEIVGVIGQACRGEPVRPGLRPALVAEGARLLAERRRRLAPFRSLSRREQEVLAGLVAGLGPAEIATRDYVSILTVRTQVKTLLRKLGARSQLEAVAQARLARWEADTTV